MEEKTKHQLQRRTTIQVIAFLLAASVACVIVAVLSVESSKPALEDFKEVAQHGVPTVATVVKTWETVEKHRQYFVESQFAVTDKKFVDTSRVNRAAFQSLHAKSQIPVLYLPTDPSHSHLAKALAPNITSSFFFIACIPLLLSIIILISRRKDFRKQVPLAVDGQP